MRNVLRTILSSCFCALSVAVAVAGTPKLDKDTCNQLRAEQAGFVQAGVLGTIQKGAEWAKANLAPDKLREVEQFILLDEQLKFGCREVTLTPEAMKAGEEALRLESNPDADPNAPPAPAKPAAASDGAAPPGAAPGANAPASASEAPAQTPTLKPRAHRRVQPHAKPKAADAYVPPAGSESTLQPPEAKAQP